MFLWNRRCEINEASFSFEEYPMKYMSNRGKNVNKSARDFSHLQVEPHIKVCVHTHTNTHTCKLHTWVRYAAYIAKNG